MEQNAPNGFFSLLKPAGMTSSDAVAVVKHLLPRGTAVGHGGTLDPDAVGVLPVCVGKATRLFDYMIDKQKTYICELTLGIETDTQDQTGKIVAVKPVYAGRAEIEDALPALTGDILQIPPMFSAIKKDGRRLYDVARKGGTVEIEPRPVHVDAITYLSDEGNGRHRLAVQCRKGVYIRTLMYDLGRMLGCGGHMSFLMRSRAGAFDQSESVTVEEIRSAAEAGTLYEYLYPMDHAVQHLVRVDIPKRLAKKAVNGVAMPVEDFGVPIPQGDPVRLYLNDTFAGIGVSDGTCIRYKAMLMTPGH